VRYRISQC